MEHLKHCTKRAAKTVWLVKYLLQKQDDLSPIPGTHAKSLAWWCASESQHGEAEMIDGGSMTRKLHQIGEFQV